MGNSMREFILWSNCNNCCDFCWQANKPHANTVLTKDQMVQSLTSLYSILDSALIPGDDILIVGGEIFNNWGFEVSKTLNSVFRKLKTLVESKQIRFVYVNTNLLYTDLSVLNCFLNTFQGFEDHVKFTTSWDAGFLRFKDSTIEQRFLSNLKTLTSIYPRFNVVVNIIMTKDLLSIDLSNLLNMFDNLKVHYINFLPLIPLTEDSPYKIDFADIAKFLSRVETFKPGYIQSYIKDFDFNQNKILYEFNSTQGFVECTADYNTCHHNINFKRVLGDECYICKLKEIFC